MGSTASLPGAPLDVPTLSFVAVCLGAMLGLLFVFAWFRERHIRALAWWGAAYLIGAFSLALWNAPAPIIALPSEVPGALVFVACGMIWNGVRLFHGRSVLGVANFAGAVAWLFLCQLAAFAEGSSARFAVGAAVVAVYTFFIAFELGRERRKTLFSRRACCVVPALHAAIFLLPLAMREWLPILSNAGIAVFAVVTTLYAVGTAIMVLMMVKDRDVNIYRDAASIDFLTGLLNRRAFFEHALTLCALQARLNEPVTLLLFDLDHFKMINDRFGHAVGDDVLKLFAEVARRSMRATDIIARLGGEEFAAIVPAGPEIAAMIAERLRTAFETTAVTVNGHAIAGTVSVGAATASPPATDLDGMITRADAALYQAKREGRNRLCAAASESVQDQPAAMAA
jgi:diguanylate cyclase (GGDEF)-like protein